MVFYISDHGFGHASRSLALIENIIQLYKEVKIFIKTGEKQLNFCKAYLSKFNCNSIKYKLKNWINGWDYYTDQQESFYKENKVDLIVSDITPQAFIVGAKFGIKTLTITNFTWYEMYKEFLVQIT